MNEMSRLDVADHDFRARFTTAEFEQMNELGAFDDMRVELVDGELERMQSAMNLHAMRQAKAVFMLAQVFGIDRVRGAVGIDLGEGTLLESDAAALHSKVAENRRLTAADMLLVVEVSETRLRRDLGMKRRKYAGAGIPHYWVVDGEAGVTHIFGEPVDGSYAAERQTRFGEPIAVPGADATVTID